MITLDEQKLKAAEILLKGLTNDVVQSQHFVSVIRTLTSYIKGNQDTNIEALKRVTQIVSTLESKVAVLEKPTIDKIQPQIETLKKQIASLKLEKGDKGDNANPQDVAQILKQDQNFLNSLKGKDSNPEEIVDLVLGEVEKKLPMFSVSFRDALELLTGDDRLDVAAIKGLEEKLIPKGGGLAGGQSGIRMFVGGTKKGLVKSVDIKAGPGASVAHSTVNGLDTITISAGASSDVTSGSGAPVSTPSSLGARYIDTGSGNIYMAVGTSSSADWRIISSFA